MTSRELWQRYQSTLCSFAPGLALDPSRMGVDDAFLARMAPALERAFGAMAALEAGATANPDEARPVGHYWLRAPSARAHARARGADPRQRGAGEELRGRRPRQPREAAARGALPRLLAIGIGGSALGPMFVADALGRGAADRMSVAFLDNTDPDGIARTLDGLAGALPDTLVLVTSKSSGTAETRNGMRLAADAYGRAGLSFAPHAAAVTLPGSALDQEAEAAGWLARFPMFDWVGGRTSVLSAAGLLPAALQGIDVDGLLAGAAACDEATRVRDPHRNPAALLALTWHFASGGRGEKAMVVLPYKDRLLLLGRYLPAARDGVARQAPRPRRPARGPGAHRLRQQGLDRPARLRAAAARRAERLLRAVRARARARRHRARSRARRHRRRLPARLLARHARRARRERAPVAHAHAAARRRALASARSSRCSSARSASTPASSTSTRTTSPASRRASRPPAPRSRSRTACSPRSRASLRAPSRSRSAPARPEQAETVFLLLEHLCASGRARVAEPGPPGAARFVAR